MDIETKFNRESTDKRKYVDLIPEFIINNDKDYGQLLDWRFTEYLLVFKYRKKYLKHLETQVMLLLYSFIVIHIE